jgi:arylsulfatase A-like enzyme
VIRRGKQRRIDGIRAGRALTPMRRSGVLPLAASGHVRYHARVMSRPNILFILVDDLGWMDLSCQGSAFYQTPHIDRLAAEGMRFTDAYAAAPVCSPTRASIMSGKYPARVGLTQYIGGNGRGRLIGAPYIDHLPPTEASIASALRDGGYQTWHVGKWHLGGVECRPEHHGFDVNVAGCEMGCPRHGYFSPWKIPNLPDGPAGEYLDDHLGDRAVALIEGRDPDRPFFLHMSFYLVHTPLQAPPALVNKYRARARAMGLREDQALAEGERHPVWHKRHETIKRRRYQSHPVYAAMVEALDMNVGKLLDALGRQGIADQTIVIFTSDNGGLATSEGSPTCNLPLREGKGWLEDGGTREPMLIRWPGRVEPGTTSDAIVTSPDFYPTLLHVAGLDDRPEQHVDGKSFADALSGNPHERGPIFWHYPHYSNQGATPGAAVREGDWKLIEWYETGRRALFNLRDDIGELHDLAAERTDIAERLGQALDRWRDQVEAITPQPNPDYVPPDDPSADPMV